jgi:hypothetical protein
LPDLGLTLGCRGEDQSRVRGQDVCRHFEGSGSVALHSVGRVLCIALALKRERRSYVQLGLVSNPDFLPHLKISVAEFSGQPCGFRERLTTHVKWRAYAGISRPILCPPQWRVPNEENLFGDHDDRPCPPVRPERAARNLAHKHGPVQTLAEAIRVLCPRWNV